MIQFNIISIQNDHIEHKWCGHKNHNVKNLGKSSKVGGWSIFD